MASTPTCWPAWAWSEPLSKAPALLRGAAAGLLTAALTIAAHSVGGGGIPAGATAGQLLVVAAIVGGVAVSAARANDVRVLFCLLAAGQLVGHAVLSAQGHIHGTAGAPPAWVMPAAHLVAIVVGAVLISVGDRLCRALTQVVSRIGRQHLRSPVSPRLRTAAHAEHPTWSNLQLAFSISHRGPPARHHLLTEDPHRAKAPIVWLYYRVRSTPSLSPQ